MHSPIDMSMYASDCSLSVTEYIYRQFTVLRDCIWVLVLACPLQSGFLDVYASQLGMDAIVIGNVNCAELCGVIA